MRASVGVRLQHLLPQSLLARLVYRASRSESAWIRRPLIRWFASHYRVDLDEAEESDPERYPSFNAFFTRALKAGARPVDADRDTVVSPVDGRLTEHGNARDGRLLQAKGLEYRLEELVGDGPFDARVFADAAFATVYLAPHDYHRVHMPVDGALIATRYIPGRRFSVNAATACGIRNLFCRNERVVCSFETARGPMALVLVGALNVSSISTSVHGEIESGRPRYWTETPPIACGKGEEIARFNLGSTVIVLFPGEHAAWDARLQPGARLRLGEPIGRMR